MKHSCQKIKTFFYALAATGNFFQHFLLLLLRLYFGWNFFQGGLRKFQAIDETASFFGQLGLPLPEFSAYLVAIVECVGGVFLMIGFMSRLVAIPLSIVLITALLSAHTKGAMQIFSNPHAFLAESPVPFLIVTLVIFVCGAGWFSVDYLIRRICSRIEYKKNTKDTLQRK